MRSLAKKHEIIAHPRLVGGDTLSSFFQAFDSKNAGARLLAVDPSVVINDGNGGANYDVTFATPITLDPQAKTLPKKD